MKYTSNRYETSDINLIYNLCNKSHTEVTWSLVKFWDSVTPSDTFPPTYWYIYNAHRHIRHISDAYTWKQQAK